MIAHNLPEGALTDLTDGEMVMWAQVYSELRKLPIMKTAAIFNTNQVILDVRLKVDYRGILGL